MPANKPYTRQIGGYELTTIRGVQLNHHIDQTGMKYVYVPPAFDYEGAGTIISFHANRIPERFKNDQLFDTPEQTVKAVRDSWATQLELYVIDLDNNPHLWKLVKQNREKIIGAIRLLDAGIDLNSKQILDIITVMEWRHNQLTKEQNDSN